MLANQASSTPPTTAACSDQMMQDGAGRFSTSLGQSPGLQMAWRRLPVFRSDIELVPRTASLGVLLASGFWGGAICLHMSKGEPFVVQSVLLLLTWLGPYLRVPGVLASFSAPSKTVRPSADIAEVLVP